VIIEEIMTRDVLSVAPGTSLKDVAQILVANGVSGVPVCGSDGEVLGVVSEADILRKEEGFDPGLPRPLAWLARKLDRELDKISARTAAEAMTAPALTVRPTQQASEVARLMVDNAVNRLPVVVDGRLVGIVSRADLVRAFSRADEEIEREIREDVLLGVMLLDYEDFEIAVDDGCVRIGGRVNTEDDARILERCVRRVPGVVALEADLHWRNDDSPRQRHAGSEWA
jgi:CBS domain-containing protein